MAGWSDAEALRGGTARAVLEKQNGYSSATVESRAKVEVSPTSGITAQKPSLITPRALITPGYPASELWDLPPSGPLILTPRLPLQLTLFFSSGHQTQVHMLGSHTHHARNHLPQAFCFGHAIEVKPGVDPLMCNP